MPAGFLAEHGDSEIGRDRFARVIVQDRGDLVSGATDMPPRALGVLAVEDVDVGERDDEGGMPNPDSRMDGEPRFLQAALPSARGSRCEWLRVSAPDLRSRSSATCSV